jgi:RNA polymerase sigma-70 factor (ECF subfamily)
MGAPDDYVQQLIAVQPQLHAYILGMVFDVASADDVLQSANLVIYQKASEFDPAQPFRGWAFAIARVECLNYWKSRARQPFTLSEKVLEIISARAEGSVVFREELRQHLRDCLAELQPRHRQMLEGRYKVGGSVQKIASELGRPESSVSQALYRLRKALLDCVQSRLSKGEASCT